MTNEQIKKEFARWIDIGRPIVWVRTFDGEWCKEWYPSWMDKFYYVVDDKYAELRKLQIDEPDTKFQYKDASCGWVDAEPTWDINTEYRVKPKEWYEDYSMLGKPVWVRDSRDYPWELEIFAGYTEELYNIHKKDCPFITSSGVNARKRWKYAKPVICDDLYKGE